MSERAIPPDDITPRDFFTRWVPDAVATDAERRRRLGETRATIVFQIEGNCGGCFTLRIAEGVVRGEVGDEPEPDLRVRVDEATWRRLNSGDLSAPQALLSRKVRLDGDFLLGLKLHLILG
ncbi:MAG: SCP2 sterol-binding domain-containing protein [Proteobacteria bacterium]|nr:SCP2 sterol-binding domain-containing protein [Pseudomonadota bacterium]